MRITLESDYALRILTAIAGHDGVVDAGTVSAETSVSAKFALKILRKLVQGGLVRSYKGVKGGYKLDASPEDITLRRVIELIDGPIVIARCLENTEECSIGCDKTACAYHHIFESISLNLAKRLERITISDVINKSYSIE